MELNRNYVHHYDNRHYRRNEFRVKCTGKYEKPHDATNYNFTTSMKAVDCPLCLDLLIKKLSETLDVMRMNRNAPPKERDLRPTQEF